AALLALAACAPATDEPAPPSRTAAPDSVAAAEAPPAPVVEAAPAPVVEAAPDPLGVGFVHIAPGDDAVLYLYPAPGAAPTDSLDLRFDQGVHSHVATLHGSAGLRLRPEILKLDYGLFFLRCLEHRAGWCRTVLDEERGTTRWLPLRPPAAFLPWPAFLTRVFAIERRDPAATPIRTRPDDDAEMLPFTGEDCFDVVEVRGRWARIRTIDACTEAVLSDGWLRWRDDDGLRIVYALLL
ncbi:MAG: hypothetical protein R3247_11420, partial [Rhodothermales bacterium]|nr:hypothetical protein [Rhodothermales bacterium]